MQEVDDDGGIDVCLKFLASEWKRGNWMTLQMASMISTKRWERRERRVLFRKTSLRLLAQRLQLLDRSCSAHEQPLLTCEKVGVKVLPLLMLTQKWNHAWFAEGQIDYSVFSKLFSSFPQNFPTRTQGKVEVIEWSDHWREDLQRKVNGTTGCSITNQQGIRFLVLRSWGLRIALFCLKVFLNHVLITY